MTKHNGSAGGGSEGGSVGGSDGAQPHVDIFQFLRDHGFQQKAAWIEIDVDSQKKDDAAAAKPKSGAAQKKARQRANETKVKECYAKTENDADARALVSAVGKAIVDQPIVRAAFWLTLRNPDAVFLGDQVSRLGPVLQFIVRSIIWCSRVGTNRPAA